MEIIFKWKRILDMILFCHVGGIVLDYVTFAELYVLRKHIYIG